MRSLIAGLTTALVVVAVPAWDATYTIRVRWSRAARGSSPERDGPREPAGHPARLRPGRRRGHAGPRGRGPVLARPLRDGLCARARDAGRGWSFGRPPVPGRLSV